MKIERWSAWGLCLGVAFCGAAALAQNVLVKHLHDSGQSITASYEGWFQNKDGSFSILFGYYNRNEKQVLDIPIGPQNRIEPGGPDQGQPTHFLIRRQWGVFIVRVPKDFGDKKLTWTITANDQTTAVPASLDPLWVISPVLDADGNTPPLMRLDDGGPTGQGPLPVETTRATTVGDPLELTVWVADDARMIPGMRKRSTPPIALTWSKFRGPGAVTFENIHPAVEKEDPPAANTAVSGRAATTATFSEPGEYVLEVAANDLDRLRRPRFPVLLDQRPGEGLGEGGPLTPLLTHGSGGRCGVQATCQLTSPTSPTSHCKAQRECPCQSE